MRRNRMKSRMYEVRCKRCGRLLAKISGIGEFKCPRCGYEMTVDTGQAEQQKNQSAKSAK